MQRLNRSINFSIKTKEAGADVPKVTGNVVEKNADDDVATVHVVEHEVEGAGVGHVQVPRIHQPADVRPHGAALVGHLARSLRRYLRGVLHDPGLDEVEKIINLAGDAVVLVEFVALGLLEDWVGVIDARVEEREAAHTGEPGWRPSRTTSEHPPPTTTTTTTTTAAAAEAARSGLAGRVVHSTPVRASPWAGSIGRHTCWSSGSRRRGLS